MATYYDITQALLRLKSSIGPGEQFSARDVARVLGIDDLDTVREIARKLSYRQDVRSFTFGAGSNPEGLWVFA